MGGYALQAVYNQISYVKVFGYKGFDFTEHVDEKRSTVITAKPKRVVFGIKVSSHNHSSRIIYSYYVLERNLVKVVTPS
jgi:hypothetical protein